MHAFQSFQFASPFVAVVTTVASHAVSSSTVNDDPLFFDAGIVPSLATSKQTYIITVNDVNDRITPTAPTVASARPVPGPGEVPAGDAACREGPRQRGKSLP